MIIYSHLFLLSKLGMCLAKQAAKQAFARGGNFHVSFADVDVACNNTLEITCLVGIQVSLERRFGSLDDVFTENVSAKEIKGEASKVCDARLAGVPIGIGAIRILAGGEAGISQDKIAGGAGASDREQLTRSIIDVDTFIDSGDVGDGSGHDEAKRKQDRDGR
jgi:hypothetical protein